ncbi:tyrosine-type recombinase/integrase [Aquimarina sp. U1-2]|uniref:tyrosine-type recombinase/integrase n=1 Tax=Aquimarina sp. U1-2 TaxID=2823141 RepID=UPI0035304028
MRESACKKATINKTVHLQMLRNSFATHLLEQRINLRYIRVLFGHQSSKVTQIYTHIALKNLKM